MKTCDPFTYTLLHMSQVYPINPFSLLCRVEKVERFLVVHDEEDRVQLDERTDQE